MPWNMVFQIPDSWVKILVRLNGVKFKIIKIIQQEWMYSDVNCKRFCLNF